MFFNSLTTIFIVAIAFFNGLAAEIRSESISIHTLQALIDYEVHDIGTLQTNSSQVIALNNQGQILGWYNIDGTDNGTHFFVREKNGIFHELPSKIPDSGLLINWKYLTNEGKAYGTFAVNINTISLCLWDQKNGVVKIGNLPGKEISAVNDAGQVLIKSVVDSENEKTIIRPVIWHNGSITKLRGLEGDVGLESEESYGFDMNNKGEVVGQSLVSLSYKNEIYKQVHAVKWTSEQTLDLHKIIPKTAQSYATAINDLGDILINHGHNEKMNNIGYVCSFERIKDKNNYAIVSLTDLNRTIKQDLNSIWLRVVKIISVNDNGEVIAQGETIYGEEHAMLLTPAPSK
jgi:uncharacterized membrane protein